MFFECADKGNSSLGLCCCIMYANVTLARSKVTGMLFYAHTEDPEPITLTFEPTDSVCKSEISEIS